MKRFVGGEDRTQGVLIPEFLDDYVAEDNPVRVIDVFVAELDLAVLGFEDVVPETTGRPAYRPATMLKIYVYGYINQIQSSRRLERETARNVEMMWLTGRLTPDFKTIADFRKDNGAAIRSACRQFRCALPEPEPVHPRDRRDRRQPVQGMQLSRQVVLARIDPAPHGAGRGKHRALFVGAGNSGPPGR
jgi:transposase